MLISHLCSLKLTKMLFNKEQRNLTSCLMLAKNSPFHSLCIICHCLNHMFPKNQTHTRLFIFSDCRSVKIKKHFHTTLSEIVFLCAHLCCSVWLRRATDFSPRQTFLQLESFSFWNIEAWNNTVHTMISRCATLWVSLRDKCCALLRNTTDYPNPLPHDEI